MDHEIRSIDLDDIHITEERRPIDEDILAALSSSMRQIGLQTPITVRVAPGPITIDGKEVYQVPVLVAGAHRLAAAKKLGWEKIGCLVLDGDEHDALIWECDENLCRTELSQGEIAYYTGIRKAAWERKQKQTARESSELRPKRETGNQVTKSETGQTLPSLGGRGKRGFAEETASVTGRKKRVINQALHRAKHIGADVLKAITGTSLDKGVELDALARKSPEEQQRLAAAARTNTGISARAHSNPKSETSNPYDTYNKWESAIKRLWNRAPQEWRDRWLETVDQPVFDRTAVGGMR